MVWGYNLVWSWGAMLHNFVSWLLWWIVDNLPTMLPANEVARYIFRIVLISGVLWLMFGFIFQTNDKDDK